MNNKKNKYMKNMMKRKINFYKYYKTLNNNNKKNKISKYLFFNIHQYNIPNLNNKFHNFQKYKIRFYNNKYNKILLIFQSNSHRFNHKIYLKIFKKEIYKIFLMMCKIKMLMEENIIKLVS